MFLAALILHLVTPITVAPAPQYSALPPQQTGPVSVGRPHTCTQAQYPISALQSGIEGRTVLKFTITAEGHVKNASIDTSSGNAGLDAAAITCAGDWLYRPATQSGAPVEVPWKAVVNWKIGVTEYALVDFRILLCVTADRIGLEELKKEPLHAVMRVHFAKGALGAASLAATSGNADLDARIAACYRNVPVGLTANVPDGDELFVVALPAKVETDNF